MKMIDGVIALSALESTQTPSLLRMTLNCRKSALAVFFSAFYSSSLCRVCNLQKCLQKLGIRQRSFELNF